MEFSNAPFYTITSIDKNEITFKRDNKTVTRPHNDVGHQKTNLYLLTANDFAVFPAECSKLYSKVHVVDDITTHLYTHDKKVICLNKNSIIQQKYDSYEIKGNWFIKYKGKYSIVRHLGCCRLCSSNHEIVTKIETIKCYNINNLYTHNKYVNYENNKLIVNNYVNVDYGWKKFSELETIKIVEVDKDIVKTNKGNYDLKEVDSIDFDNEYLETNNGLASISKNTLTFKDKKIAIDDITYVIIVDNKITHIFTKTHKLCFKIGNYCKTGNRTVDNEHFPWTLYKDDIWHIMQCGNCTGASIFELEIQNVIGYTSNKIIFNRTVNNQVKKTIMTLVNTTSGLDTIVNDYDEFNTISTPKTQEPTETSEITEKQQELPPGALRDSTGRIWHIHACETVVVATGPAMGHNAVIDPTATAMGHHAVIDPTTTAMGHHVIFNTPIKPEDNKQKADKMIEIVEKSDADDTTKQEIIKSIEEVFKC